MARIAEHNAPFRSRGNMDIHERAREGSVAARHSLPAGPVRKVWYQWGARSLVQRFLVLGGLVSLIAVVVIGSVVMMLIQNAVTRNAAATTALYVDSVIAPLLPDMQQARELDDAARRALDETLGQGALGTQLAAMRLWARDGTILYSDETAVIGRRLPANPDLEAAFDGDLVANYHRSGTLGESSSGEGMPMLEIYNPLRQPWSGEVVAVIEFHEHAEALRASLRRALLISWVSVAGTIAAIFAALFATVQRASRTIDQQAQDLNRRVGELTELLERNDALHHRVRSATQRATARDERFLRRLGSDLHDGPAQLIALASLRLDSDLLLAPGTPPAERKRELETIRASLGEALQEIRSICQGLVLPQIESATLPELVEHAIDMHERRTGSTVARNIATADPALPLSGRICVYRFLQEALTNGYRHCRGAAQTVAVTTSGTSLSVTVSDDGPGFDPANVGRQSLGISGLRDRVESLGGQFGLATGKGGTVLSMDLDLREFPE